MSLDFKSITNPFIRAHLDYVEESEPPKLFHMWSALTCMSACMGRHTYMDTGIGRMYGNMFVLLVGPPGTRKSTAIKFASSFIKNIDGVKIAPDDTGGQRQGLITAIIENDELDESIETASALDPDSIMNIELTINNVDKHVLFVEAEEFGSFLGQNSLDLTRFLIKMWDGSKYRYQLRQTKMEIHDGLLTMLGGTTPTDIATLLPPEAIGQGFMSRCVLVYAPHKEKSVPPSQATLNADLVPHLQKFYLNAVTQMNGNVEQSLPAQAMFDKLYAHDLAISDTRFIYYAERRMTHLMKLALVMCVARGSMLLEPIDIEEAHKILAATELRMPDALGEYGMNPVSVARNKMLEYLRFAGEPVSEKVLWATMQRDLKMVDFKNSLSALVNAEKIVPINADGKMMFLYNDTVTKMVAGMADDELDKLLMGDV